MEHYMQFQRFHSKSEFEGFEYKPSTKTSDWEQDFADVSMEKAGVTIHTTIQNYTAEAVLLGGNLQVNPTRIPSLRADGFRPLFDQSNSVIITILHSEFAPARDGKKRFYKGHKTSIHIPAKMLNHGSVFINELDCYIMSASQLDATREMIAKDLTQKGWDRITLPTSMSRQDPAVAYDEFKDLTRYCMERQDKIQIRIGVPVDYYDVPKEVLTLRISIADSYFIPFACNKMVYDPSLSPDDLVIENLHLASAQEYRTTWTQLREKGSIYIDPTETETLFGSFYGIALFASEQPHVDYVYRRKSQERFNEEVLYVADRTGDPKLREEVASLSSKLEQMTVQLSESEVDNRSLRASNKTLRNDIAEREKTIGRLKEHHDAKMQPDVVIKELDNEARKLDNDSTKLENERIEIEHQQKTSEQQHRATMLKSVADILKSGWGIVAAITGGILSIAALCKKYNIKLSMGT